MNLHEALIGVRFLNVQLEVVSMNGVVGVGIVQDINEIARHDVAANEKCIGRLSTVTSF